MLPIAVIITAPLLTIKKVPILLDTQGFHHVIYAVQLQLSQHQRTLSVIISNAGPNSNLTLFVCKHHEKFKERKSRKETQ